MDKPFSAYRGDEPYVFVCYAHEDSGVVYPEIKWLHDQGLNIWYDEGISAGANWRAAIGDALLNCKQFLFYISNNALRSEHCNREINLALDEGKEIIPIYLEEVELSSDLKVGLIRIQALFRDKQSDYQSRLLRVLGLPEAATEVPASSQAQPSLSAKFRRYRYLLPALGLLLPIAAVAVWMIASERPTKSISEGTLGDEFREFLEQRYTVEELAVITELHSETFPTEPVRLTTRQITRRSAKNPMNWGLMTSDGNYAVVEDRDGLWVQAIDQREARLALTTKDLGDYTHAWPGKGSEIYVGYEEGMRTFDAATGQLGEADIEVVDVYGQPVGFLPSPDEQWAIFYGDSGWWIAPTSLNESSIKPRLLITERPSTVIGGVMWSPDSDYLAYTVWQSDMSDKELSYELIVVNRDGTRRNVVADGSDLWDAGYRGEAGRYYAIDWIDASTLAYIQRGITSKLRVQTIVDGMPSGDPVAIYEWPDTWITNIQYAGGRILFDKMSINADVWLAELRDKRTLGEFSSVTSNETREWPFGWTEDGELLIEVAEFWHNEILGLYSMRPGDVELKLLTRETLKGRGSHRDALIGWNEAKQLVRVTEGKASETIYEVASDHEPFDNEEGMACREDVCAIGLKKGNKVSLHLFDTNTRTLGSPFYETQADEIKGWVLSPDTTEVAILDSYSAYIERQQSTVIFASTKGLWSKTLEFDGKVQWIDYDADGQGLYATGSIGEGGPALVYLTKEGRTDKLWREPKRWIGHPQLSPDGHSLAVTINEIDIDLWVLEGFPDAE